MEKVTRLEPAVVLTEEGLGGGASAKSGEEVALRRPCSDKM
jgi:hypothetical protein